MPALNPPALSLDLPVRRPSPVRFNLPVFFFLFAFLGVLGYGLSLWMPQETAFVYLTFLVVAYLSFEIVRHARNRPSLWLVNPVVLTSIFVFGLPFGVTNVLYFLPESYSAVLLSNMWEGDFSRMNSAMLLAFLGAFAMWRGYYSRIGRKTSATLSRTSFLSDVFRRGYEVHVPVVFVLAGVSLGCRLLMIRLGIFGYNSETSRLYEAGKVSEFLNMGTALGLLALTISSLSCFFKAPGYRLSRALTIVLLISEVAFGVVSGMKSQVLFPPLVVGACAYVAGSRISKWALVVVPILFVFSYRIIEPFRDLRYQDPNFKNRSLSSIVETIGVSASDEGALYISVDSPPLAFELAKRLNLTLMASLAIEFRDQGRLTEEDPEFLANILLSPAFAVVPRFLWPTKPYEDVGSWFNRIVLDRPFDNAVGMSPVAYLYLAGGAVAVAAGFFLIGIWQRILVEWLLPSGSGGCLLFMSQLKLFVLMPTSVYPLLIAAIRILPLVAVVQRLVFKR